MSVREKAGSAITPELVHQFEAADGSLELLLRREAGVYEPLFELESWKVTVEQREAPEACEAP